MKRDTLRYEYEFLKGKYISYSEEMYSKSLGELSVIELQTVIARVIKDDVIKFYFDQAKEYYSVKRIAIYLSMEFLIGRVIMDALVNTGILELTSQIFADNGVDIKVLEDIDDTALGNGGLGRLAACFMESAATLGYPVFGFGVYYNYGLFKQSFKEFEQIEVLDDWSSSDPWFDADRLQSITVKFRSTKVRAVPYVLPIIGYNKCRTGFDQNVFPLTLWKAEAIEGVSDEIVSKISDFLYPNDSTAEGKKLRISQEYFFVSATLSQLVKIHLAKYGTLDNFEEFYCFQMNDTHPVLGCVEFIRLMEENGYSFQEASRKAKKCFAFTNHTIMSEALESWDVNLFREVVPEEVFKIIQDLNQELIDTFIGMDFFNNDNHEVDWRKIQDYELVYNGRVHMSRIASYISYAINGVASIHTEILKDRVLNGWYQIYPERFTSCTNGVTPRRWIRCCNPWLANLLDSEIGTGWTTNLDEIRRLDYFRSNPRIIKEFAVCKQSAKKALAGYIKAKEGIEINPESIFDCQVKRIHEYKRQLMNALRILFIYNGVKNGIISNFYPTTFIVGGKAASGYYMAKRIIALIKDIQEMINNDSEINSKIKVVFLTNFGVSYGERIYSAANFSEQVSTAGTEASGTGNMKFMMNGACTIGTYDGANIEIFGEAGAENNYVFGATLEELKDLSYNSSAFMDENPEMQVVLKYLTGEIAGLKYTYQDIIDNLRGHDKYFVMYDLESYICATLRAFSDYAMEQQMGIYGFYTTKAMANMIHSGKFSSDRTIREYARNIWNITPLEK